MLIVSRHSPQMMKWILLSFATASTWGWCVRYDPTVDSFKRYREGEIWKERCRTCNCSDEIVKCKLNENVSCKKHNPSHESTCIQWSNDTCCCEKFGCVQNGISYNFGDFFQEIPGNACSRLCQCTATNQKICKHKIECSQKYKIKQTKKLKYDKITTLHEADQESYHFLLDKGIDIRSTTFIKFQVKAYSDVHVGLARKYGVTTSDFYEIILGDWKGSRSVITKCIRCSSKAVGKSPLKEGHYVSIWISWADGYIKVGTGEVVGKERFMSWHDHKPYKINYIAIHNGNGFDGTYVFTQNSY